MARCIVEGHAGRNVRSTVLMEMSETVVRSDCTVIGFTV